MKKIHYQCQRCTACCRWPGFVKIGDAEIAALAGFLAVSEDEFIQGYTRLRPQRDGLALIDKPNGECVFLEGNDCVVQTVKPVQCSGFPNTWNFPGWQETCEAVPSLVEE
ncbi:MAG TPA: YkgJ family cysteine cluster protein [Chthoniobacteraceae bacterium]